MLTNITFARGGAHLPIAHALRLPETEIISWGRDFLGEGGYFWGQEIFGFFLSQGICWIFFWVGGFFWGRRIFFGRWIFIRSRDFFRAGDFFDLFGVCFFLILFGSGDFLGGGGIFV